jgi:hypothetical protein
MPTKRFPRGRTPALPWWSCIVRFHLSLRHLTLAGGSVTLPYGGWGRFREALGFTARIPHPPIPSSEGKGSAGFCDKNWDSLFTFRGFSCIVTPEQSRRQRVKCHRDGEFARRTKEISTMLSPHPLLHTGNPPLCSNDTRSGEWSAVYCCPFPTGDPYPDSLAALRRGGFFVYGCTGLCPD